MAVTARVIEVGAELAGRWSVPWLVDQLDVKVSDRLRSSAGWCRPEKRRITIARWAVDAGLLDEVATHELAHLATRLLYGTSVRPHGVEWRALMLAAGRAPNVRVRCDDPRLLPPPRPRRSYLYRHVCARCGASRVSGRVVRAWRCVRCLEQGRDGRLDVWRVAPSRPHARAS